MGPGQEEDREQAALAGFDHHLVKPVELDKLNAVLQSAGSRSSPRNDRDADRPDVRAPGSCAACTPMTHTIRIGVRGNRLGMSIGKQTAEELRPHLGGATVQFVPVADPGRRTTSPWPGGALEHALAQGEVEMVIQNAKDASPATSGITLAAVTARFTPFDVLIAPDDAILDEPGGPPSRRTPFLAAPSS